MKISDLVAVIDDHGLPDRPCSDNVFGHVIKKTERNGTIYYTVLLHDGSRYTGDSTKVFLVPRPHIAKLLNSGNAIKDRDIRSPKNKVIRVKIKDVPTRCKITSSQTIACRDDNDSFIRALFPDYIDRYRSAKLLNDRYYQDLFETVSFMRIRMELRTDLISAAFADPKQTLRKLELEHDAQRF